MTKYGKLKPGGGGTITCGGGGHAGARGNGCKQFDHIDDSGEVVEGSSATMPDDPMGGSGEQTMEVELEAPATMPGGPASCLMD